MKLTVWPGALKDCTLCLAENLWNGTQAPTNIFCWQQDAQVATKPLQDLRGSLLLIGLAAQQRPELVAERLDLLLKVGCQPLLPHMSALEDSV